MGINRCLLINLPNTFNVSDITGVLTKKETRVWSFDLSMGKIEAVEKHYKNED